MLPSPLPSTVSSLYVRNRPLDAYVGQLADSNPLDRILACVNADPSVAEVRTITLTTAFANGLQRSVSLLGFTVSITDATADATQAGVATRWAAEINADPNLRMVVEAEASSNTVILTALEAGESFALSAGLNTSAALTTSADAAEDIPFGRAVLAVGLSGDEWSAADYIAKIADDASLSAQSDTIQITAFDATSTVVVIVRDESGSVLSTLSVAHNTSANQTAADLEAAFDADLVLVAKGITASVATDTVTIVAAAAGQDFELEVFTEGGTGAHVATSTRGLGTSIAQSLLGVSLRSLDLDSDSVGDSSDTAFAAGAVLDVITKGKIWVEVDTSEALPAFGGDVYVDTTAGAGAGRFYAASGSGRFKIDGMKWLGTAAGGAIGLLEVDLA